MKTFRLIEMALLAVVMCVNFTSCSNEEVVSDEPTQDKYITVGLGCVRENIDITDSPLSRAAATTNDLYGIQVYTVEEGKATPYAYGVFNTLDNVTVKLLSQKTYKFRISVVIDGYSRGFGFWVMGNGGLNHGSQFTYSTDAYLATSSGYSWNFERFYGELDNYTPVENENVIVETKRVSYGAKYIAENLSEGCIDINVTHGDYSLYTVNLTTTNYENDNIYTFYDVSGAYYNNDYSANRNLTINWTKDNGEVVPLGTYTVTFKRNVKTTIRIKAGDLSINNGITVTKEDTPFSDDENEYIIEGGEIITVPVNSSQS